MGVMTQNALPFEGDLMRAARSFRQYRFVASKADYAGVCLQLLRIVRSMGAVAGDASARLYRRVNERFFHFILKIRMAGQANLEPRIRLKPEFVILISSRSFTCRARRLRG
jgi:hypothetical protein